MRSDAIHYQAAIEKDESISTNIKHFTNEFDIDDVNKDAQHAASLFIDIP